MPPLDTDTTSNDATGHVPSEREVANSPRMQAMAAIRVRRDDDSDDGGTNDQQLALQTETDRKSVV